MIRILISALALSVLSVPPLWAKPVAHMSPGELIAWASDQKACGDKAVIEAIYVAAGNSVDVTCGEATGFVPLAAAAGGLAGRGGGQGVSLGESLLSALSTGSTGSTGSTSGTQ